MTEFVRTFQLGQAKISIINIGDIYLPLGNHLSASTDEIATHDNLHGILEDTTIPIQFTLIELPQTRVLVDAGLYDIETYPEYAISGYEPPLALVDRLQEMGIQPADIDHVVITHRHWDHFNGTTFDQDGKYVPRFPNATCYLGQPDWERAAPELAKPESEESRTLKVLQEQEMLQLVSDELEIADGVTIIPAPGETYGHQIVRVHSDGETLYSLGDLYHHAVEYDHPEWAVTWANIKTLVPSRESFMQRALADNALLTATHIVPIGRFHETPDGIRWQPLD